MPSPDLIVFYPVKRFPNKQAECVFLFFPLLWIISLTPFITKPDSSRELTIFIILFIFSLEIINVVVPDPNIFSWIAASIAYAAAVNPNGIKTLLTNGFTRMFIKGKPVFSNGPRSLPRNPPDYVILCKWIFDNFILAEEPCAKVLRSFETCVIS